MKKNTNRLFLFVVILSVFSGLRAQEKITLTLEEAVLRARRFSPAAMAAQHSFRASYWNWRSFQADQLPSVYLTSSPSLNRSIQAITNPDGSDSYVRRDQLTVDASVNVSQNIPFTGGRVYARTALQRIDLFSNDSYAYKSTPMVVGYEQDLFGYNTQKWQRKIQPLRYEEAKKSYIETMENVSRTATQKFFNLAVAQTAWEIARDNYANADTLHRIAEGRYNIGTITENDILQLEINKLSAQTNMINARMDVDDYMFDLRSYLGITEEVDIEVIPEEKIPVFGVDELQALDLALQNNSGITYLQRQAIESESAVAAARAQRGFQADFYLEFGLSQTGIRLPEAYRSPLDQQLISVGFRVPILDWGVGKGKVKVAQSNRDRIRTEIEQSQTDFRQSILKVVKQFNLQADRVAIAYKTDETAGRRHDVTQKLYLLGKATMLELNAAITEKDNARKNYISSLYQFWNLYYNLRSLTGFDFEQQKLITEDFKLIIQ